jgi:hypothetical protein
LFLFFTGFSMDFDAERWLPEADRVQVHGTLVQMLPVPDAKGALYLHESGNVYSKRVERSTVTGHKVSGLYCAANRFLVTELCLRTDIGSCIGSPNHPCDHKITGYREIQFHHALRASKLVSCDLIDRQVIPSTLKKEKYLLILRELLAQYCPFLPVPGPGKNYLDDMFKDREAGVKFIRKQVLSPRVPWAVMFGELPPNLAQEIGLESARGDEFDAAREELERAFEEEAADLQPADEPEPGPVVDEQTRVMLEAVRLFSEQKGLGYVDMILRRPGANGSLKSDKYELPRE